MALTNEERRALALAEVRHARPAGQIALATIELSHPALAEPARVVCDNHALTARLETGDVVEFTAVAFTAVPPAQSETRWPQIDLRIDGAAALIEEKLEQALAVDAPIEVTFREYVRDDAMEGPARVISGLELDKTDTDDLSVRGTAGFAGLDARFGLTYDPAEYPGVR